jgi:thioester reductase-like protein
LQFLGKFLVATLLRHFDVDKIFLLIRSKKDEDPDLRMKKMLSDEVMKIKLNFGEFFQESFNFHSFSMSSTKSALNS